MQHCATQEAACAASVVNSIAFCHISRPGHVIAAVTAGQIRHQLLFVGRNRPLFRLDCALTNAAVTANAIAHSRARQLMLASALIVQTPAADCATHAACASQPTVKPQRSLLQSVQDTHLLASHGDSSATC